MTDTNVFKYQFDTIMLSLTFEISDVYFYAWPACLLDLNLYLPVSFGTKWLPVAVLPVPAKLREIKVSKMFAVVSAEVYHRTTGN